MTWLTSGTQVVASGTGTAYADARRLGPRDPVRVLRPRRVHARDGVPDAPHDVRPRAVPDRREPPGGTLGRPADLARHERARSVSRASRPPARASCSARSTARPHCRSARTYTYDAVAAALVGGVTAIQGGHGSVWRAFFGAFFIASVTRSAAAARVLDRRPDPRRGDRRRARRRAGAGRSEGARALRASPTRSGVTSSRFSILAVAAVIPRAAAAGLTRDDHVPQRLRRPADVRRLRAARARRRALHDHRRVRPLDRVDVRPRGHGRGADGAGRPACGILAALAVGVGGGLVQGTIITRLRAPRGASHARAGSSSISGSPT